MITSERSQKIKNAFDTDSMTDFDIHLRSPKGQLLIARVKFIYPDHFIVDIQHLKLTLKVFKNTEGKLECEEAEELHSKLVKDVCAQINARLQQVEN